MKKVGFIIPGFNESTKEEKYQKIGSYFKARGIEPIYVEIPWPRSTISSNVEYFLKIYRHTTADQKYVQGFSFGAMIAFIAASRVNFDKVILCSVSPYFYEDKRRIPKRWWEAIGKRRAKDFIQYKSLKLAKDITSPIELIAGGDEHWTVGRRMSDIYDSLKVPMQHTIIDKVNHDVADKNYQKEIEKTIMHLGK